MVTDFMMYAYRYKVVFSNCVFIGMHLIFIYKCCLIIR